MMKFIFWGWLSLALPLAARADEGMWLFNQPPRRLLAERYHFDATDPWLDHLRRASIRFNFGGSGSFVSRDGLLISNHHVGADALQKLSTKEKNYLRDGFYARTPAEEVKCLDLELNVLESIEDVSARVNAAVPPEATPAAAFAARRKILAEIEKQSQDQTGLRAEVVTLWQGGAYHLYRYKRYTDVRLVFAPEQQMAFYGGDPDNFVCTGDIIGGNSGSPVVSRAGDFVGIIFDGNLQSLPWDYAYGDKDGRAIAVDSAAILHALQHIFQAKALVRELQRSP
jgi:hypothetical protein